MSLGRSLSTTAIAWDRACLHRRTSSRLGVTFAEHSESLRFSEPTRPMQKRPIHKQSRCRSQVCFYRSLAAQAADLTSASQSQRKRLNYLSVLPRLLESKQLCEAFRAASEYHVWTQSFAFVTASPSSPGFAAQRRSELKTPKPKTPVGAKFIPKPPQNL